MELQSQLFQFQIITTIGHLQRNHLHLTVHPNHLMDHQNLPTRTLQLATDPQVSLHMKLQNLAMTHLSLVIMPLNQVIMPLNQAIMPLNQATIPLSQVMLPLNQVTMPQNQIIMLLFQVLPFMEI